jgi:tetratricopeptide (TPR) repeat protein
MGRTVIRLLLLWSLCAGIAMANPNAEKDDRAREWFVNGQVLYQEGRYRDALVAFEAAYRMSARPTILRSIAYCHEQLEELEQAVDVLYRFRGLAPEERWSEIDRRISRLEVQLEQQSEEAVLAQPQPQPQPQPQSPPAAVQQSSERMRYAPPKWRMGGGPLVLYSVAGVGAIVGGIFAANAQRARKQTAALCSRGDAIFCRADAAPFINQDWLYSLIADTGFGFAGAGFVGGTVWMVLDNSRANAVQVGVNPMGIGVRGQF